MAIEQDGPSEAEMGLKPEVSKEESDLRTLFTEKDWNREIQITKEFLEEGGITLAANMKKFDEKKFGEEMKISDEEWQKVESNIKEVYEPDAFLTLAAGMKIVDPERFKRIQTVVEERYDEVVEYFGHLDERNENYFRVYEAGKQVYGQRFVDAVSLDWTKIREAVNNNLLNGEIITKKFDDERLSSDEVVAIAAGAQRNKPENIPDIAIDEFTYHDFRDGLMTKLTKGETIRAFSLFVGSKGLKVKKMK